MKIIMSNFPEDMSVPRFNELELGFIEPGLKGKNNGLQVMKTCMMEMVEKHKQKKEIML